MRPFLFLILAAVVLGGIFLAIKPSRTTTAIDTPGKKVFTLVVKDRALVSGPATLEATAGDTVTIKITVDEDEELHLHGYDKHVDLTKGVPGELTFTANLTGRFPYELEHSSTEIGTLEVAPK
jgi:plastocyanin